MDEAERKEVGRRMAAGRAAKKEAAISALLIAGKAKTHEEADTMLKAEAKRARNAAKAMAPEARAPAAVLADPAPSTANSNITGGRTFARFSSRNGGVLHVANKSPDKDYYWAHKPNVERRKAMGYDVVSSDDKARTFLGSVKSGATSVRETHDLVLMATSKANAAAIRAENARRSKQRMDGIARQFIRDGKSLAGSGVRTFGNISSTQGRHE